jgi:arginine exporter protein ArgO
MPPNEMLAAFGGGALAGYAIAIPVGAIAVLIVETGVRRGFRMAAAAGAGAATADGLYATLAMIGGTAIAALLEPWSRPLRIAAVFVLLAIGLRGLLRVARASRASGASPASGAAGSPRAGLPGSDVAVDPDERAARRSSHRALLGTYARLVGLTILNPSTVVYFAALILALPQLGSAAPARVAFVAGAFLASLSWQTVLAGIGAVAHHRLPPAFQVGISALGNLMIIGFAVGLAGALV